MLHILLCNKEPTHAFIHQPVPVILCLVLWSSVWPESGLTCNKEPAEIFIHKPVPVIVSLVPWHLFCNRVRLKMNMKIKSRCVCKTLCPGGNKVQKDISSCKVKIKVTRSLTFVSCERVLLVEYACQI